MKQSLGIELDASGGAITDQVIYTVPTGYRAVVTMFFLSNVGGSTTTVGAKWNDGSSIEFLAGKSLNAGDQLQFGGEFGNFLVMDEGDTMSVSVASGGDATVIMSYDQIRKGID